MSFSNTDNNKIVHVVMTNNDILGSILGFVGAGNFRFLAVINKQFRETYLSVHGSPQTTLQAVVAWGPHAAEMWLKERGGRRAWYPTMLCKEAAKQGNLEVLKWARQNGCGWNDLTCACAAGNGHLEGLEVGQREWL
jgi:hypothetical protein